MKYFHYKQLRCIPLIVLACLVAVGIPGGPAMAESIPSFETAQPVWPEGRSEEMNLFVGFRAVFETPEAESVVLRMTASSIYRVWLNGQFLGHGPARGPLDYHRVDEYEIAGLLQPGENVVAVDVAGYNVNSYYLFDQPAFLQAEVVAGPVTLAATGLEGPRAIEGQILDERQQKVQRYSFQRTFVEDYVLSADHDAWRATADAAFDAVALETFPALNLLPRRVPYSDFYIVSAVEMHSRGTFDQGVERENLWRDRSLVNISPEYKGFHEEDLVSVLSTEMQKTEITSRDVTETPLGTDWSHSLDTGEYLQYNLGRNISGFPRFDITVEEPTRIFVAFDETLRGEYLDFRRMATVNVIAYTLEPGSYTLEAFEPYTMGYIKILALEGGGVVENVGIRAFENTDTQRATFRASDGRLEKLYEAGRHTFAQNATDVFMDCPSRERAGWLCDSFFTARSALVLSGDTTVEKNFVESYYLPEVFRTLPEGMLPMCYPADHYNSNFIPNWAMWFVVQLEEYAARSGDTELVANLEDRVMALLDYFEPFENEDGLLESLEAWVFVEWSAANQFVQDVNYPSNMLYASTLSTAAKLYDKPELEAKAEAIRETIREQSFDGEFFVDNAIRHDDGTLEVTRNRTEVCQYFAFFFDVASVESHPELWRRLHEDFGPHRTDTGAWEEVHVANSFIGNMVRVELLSEAGKSNQILEESVDYLMYMVERTNTLWENVHDHASLNHGFASHIVVTLLRDILGAYHIDPVNQVLQLRFIETGLDWCEATIPLGDELISLRWTSDGETITYDLDLPAGFTVEMVEHENAMPAVEGAYTR